MIIQSIYNQFNDINNSNHFYFVKGTPELKNNQAFFDTLVNHFGGWFTSDNNLTPVESDIQLEKEIIKLKELGFSYSFLISIYVGPDLKNTSRNLIAVSKNVYN